MMILKRRFIDLEPDTHKIGMTGEYRLRVIREDGSVRQDTGWFPNIILNSGLNRWGTGAVIAGAEIGTGTSVPTAAQTALDVARAYTTNSGTGNKTLAAQGSPPYFTTHTSVYRTALGQLNSSVHGNYTEVGVGWAAGSMFSRALILDSGGSPTSITVLSTEQLDIIYRLRSYPPTVDTSTTVTIGGVSYTVVGRASNVTSASSAYGWYFTPLNVASGMSPYFNTWIIQAFTGNIGIITGEPSGTLAQASTGSDVAYANNSMSFSSSVAIGLSECNLAGGIRSVQKQNSIGTFQYDFGASIPKNNTKTLVLNTSFTWARKP